MTARRWRLGMATALAVAGCWLLAAQASAYVYWASSGNGTIARANLDGTAPTWIIFGGSLLDGLAVDDQHLYWANSGKGTIGRANLDGTGANQSFITGANNPSGVAVDGQHLYWVNNGLATIARANLDGTGVNQSFITGTNTPHGLAVDGQHLYWANSGTGAPGVGTIGRANLDGTGVNQSFITNASGPSGVAVDGQHLYWTNASANTLGRANLDGTGVNQSFIAGTSTMLGVAVDGQHLYWANANLESIGRANLDGTGVNQSFIANPLRVDFPHGVAVDSGATPTISTSASPDVTLGGSVNDSGALAGGSSPTGTITFRLYGPNDASCANAPAFTSSAVTVSGNGSYDSPSFTPTQAGTYRWIASYSGDSNNEAVATSCNDPNGSVDVAKVSPTLQTSASPDVTLGGSVNDSGALAGGSSPTGTITFRLYGPNDASCANAPAFTSSAVTVSGNGSYDSPSFTPTQAGTYRWIASYSGDSNNEAVATSCNDPNGSVDVAKANPTISTTPVTGVTVGANIHDEATVSGRIEAQTVANVEFELYGPGAPNCEGAALFTDAVSYPQSGGAVSSPNHVATQAGTYHWSATYTGDANNNTASSTCIGASVIAKATPTISTAASADTVLGADQLTDSATLSGRSNPLPGATVTFKLYGPNDPTCAGSPIFESADVSYPVGGGPVTSDPFTPTEVGTYRWVASYSGDANNDSADSACGDPGESTAVDEASPTVSGQASAGVAIGGKVHDTATLAAGFDPSGTIEFKLYGPGDPTCSGAPAFASSVPVAGNGSYDSPEFTPTTAGEYRWIASYPGDAGNEPAATACGDSGAAVTVAKAQTTTALAASPNPALRAAAVSLTATVSGAGPSGQVTFLDGTTAIGAAALQGGKATLTITGLAPGSHLLTARYGGDANNRESTSSPLTVVIEDPAPNVTLTYSPNHPHRPNPKGGPRYAIRFADEAPGVTFYCRLDKAPFKPCHSPRVYRHLKRGRHVFKVKSVDAAGRESAVQTVKFFAGRRR